MPRKQELAHRRTLPPATELAARVRDGMSLRGLASELGTEASAVAQRLTSAGFATTGETEKEFQLRRMKQHLQSTLLVWAEPWMSEAICAQTDPEAFFPEKGGSTQEAKRVCLGCPVRETCLEWALDRGERFGIFGGKSERERRKIVKDREAAA